MSRIPRLSLNLTRDRYIKRCARCGGPGAQTHHRRGRGVVDKHTHCPCNLVLLCAGDNGCHEWVHAHPILAMLSGFVVSRSCTNPSTVPIHTPWGIRLHDCTGGSS